MNAFQRYPLASFFALAYVFSWVFWLPAAAAGRGWIGPMPSTVLQFVGGLGPMMSAIMVTAFIADRDAIARLRRRSLTGRRWILAAVVIPAALFVVSALAAGQMDGRAIDWRATGLGAEAPSLPRPLFWLANLVFYGYGEEVGWRGFALPRLQSRMSALRASLLLAVGWAGWHLPLFAFTDGLSRLDAGGIVGWLLSLALGSILLTWLFNSSRGSIAAVAVFTPRSTSSSPHRCRRACPL